MCTMEKIVSCEISFIPIQSENYIEDVEKVLDIIKSYDLEYSIGVMSTTVRGKKNILINLISDICDNMEDKCKFVLDFKLSNICGCSYQGI